MGKRARDINVMFCQNYVRFSCQHLEMNWGFLVHILMLAVGYKTDVGLDS